MGRFHTERSAIQREERGSGEQGSSNNINHRSKENALISSSNIRGETPLREMSSNVGAGNGGLLEIQREPRRDSASRSLSSSGNCGVPGNLVQGNQVQGNQVPGNETSVVRKGEYGLGMRTSQGHQVSGEALPPVGAGTSSSRQGRSESPSEWSDLSTVSSTSTVEGRKILVKVDMLVQNCLTRITYKVSSTAPIGIILPKVAAKLGTDPENVQLRVANVGNGAEGDGHRRLPRDRGLLVDVADNAEDFINRVIFAALVA